MTDPKLTPAETPQPEPLTLTILIEYDCGSYCAQIAGSQIYGDGKTPAAALLSLASAYCATEAWESEVVLRRFAKAAKEEQRDKNAAFMEQVNEGFAALRKRAKKAKRSPRN